MSKYALIVNNVVDNIIVCEDSNISLFPGAYIKVTEVTGEAKNGGSYNLEKNKFVGAYALAKSVISINGKSSDAKIGVNGMIHQDYRNRWLYSKIIEIAVQQDDKEV